MRSITSRQISSTNILRQYHQNSTAYDVCPSSLTTSNSISLPFTYYHDSPIQQSRGNFEKISAWLDHTEKLTKTEPDKIQVSFTDVKPPTTIPSPSSVKINQQGKNKEKIKILLSFCQNFTIKWNKPLQRNVHISTISCFTLKFYFFTFFRFGLKLTSELIHVFKC